MEEYSEGHSMWIREDYEPAPTEVARDTPSRPVADGDTNGELKSLKPRGLGLNDYVIALTELLISMPESSGSRPRYRRGTCGSEWHTGST